MSPFHILLELMVELVATTGAIRHTKAPVKMSPPTNQHPDALSIARPTVSKLCRESCVSVSTVVNSAHNYSVLKSNFMGSC